MITMAQQPENIFARMSAKPIIPKVDPHETLTVPIGPPPPDLPELPVSMSAGAAPDVSTGMAAPKVNSPASLPGIKARTEDRLMADYKKDADPYGSPDNHPGFFGKFLHGLNVATGGVNRRGFEERGLENRLEDFGKQESAENLQGAQAANLTSEANARDNPAPDDPKEIKWKPLFGGNGQVVTAPNGNIVEVDGQGNLRATALPDGSTVAPKPTAAPHDAFHEWLSDPAKFEEFLKAQTGAKQTPAKGFGGFAGMYAAYHMLHDAYTHNPALLPILGPMLASAMKSNGFPLPENAASVLGTVPTGQPENEAGTPIGTAMPEAPTGTTRSRGQFAGEVLPTMQDASQEIDSLGDKLGPFAGRYSDLVTSKIGAYGPAFSALQTDLHNIATGWGRLHGNSVETMKGFYDDLNASKDPANLKAKLERYERQADIYKKGGEGRPDQIQTSPPPGADVKVKGADGKMYWGDSKTKKILGPVQ